MTRPILILIILSLSYSAIGQAKDSIFQQGIGIQSNPLSLIDIYNGPNLNLGIDVPVNSKLSIFTDLGIHNHKFLNFPNTNWAGLKGLTLREELRFHRNNFWDGKFHSSNYIGIELNYGRMSYNRTDSIGGYPGTATSAISYDNTRTFYGVSCNIGGRILYPCGIELGVNFGLGIRYNQIENNLSEEDAADRHLGDWNVPINWIQKKGNHFIGKLNLGLRIGYRFRRYARS